ncbi:aldehyde dehydrogenase family protein [Actinomadura sp. NBRC 104425]|uniref:aldehyde dehydrogenase family protein n=1 Tax=Actinomadura sp. NBRC 104425 TaxID=3032204 RepID=UPI0025544E5E|nr:aldehyde dehydrogenase family protein [Actinomadura sp. NBRC 104425]
MTINGERVSADKRIGVINPATGAEFATAPDASREQMDRAVAAAVAAGREWARDEGRRVEALKAVADAIDANVEELSSILTSEQGKPLSAAAYEVGETARWIRAAADLELPRETIVDNASVRTELLRRPFGVVAAITPWNFPLLLLGWKLGPALRAGNTMVLKPSPYTPLATLRVGEIVQEVLPPGVFNVVSGGDELGAWLTTHPDVRKISFTGSVATGKLVAAAAAPDLKRFTLELGGNDAAIILDDADPAAIAKGVFWGGFINCGQICAGIKRVFVPEHMHDDVVEAIAARARSVRMGPGTDPGVQLGPIQNRMQFDRVSGLVREALDSGATAVAGGRPMDRDGYFFEPTILTRVREGMRIVDEEQFGPAMPVLTYKTLDEAIERANATEYGLSGSVWSSDVERATKVAEQLDCGTAFVNDHLALSPDVPFGGSKWSGIGVENGPWGLEEFTQLQAVQRPQV